MPVNFRGGHYQAIDKVGDKLTYATFSIAHHPTQLARRERNDAYKATQGARAVPENELEPLITEEMCVHNGPLYRMLYNMIEKPTE